MINPILYKAKAKKGKVKRKEQDTKPVYNSRQDTCTQEQAWIAEHIYGYPM